MAQGNSGLQAGEELRTSPPLIRKLFILIAVSPPWRNCFQGTLNLLHYDAVGISQYAPKPRYNQEASSGLQAGEADIHNIGEALAIICEVRRSLTWTHFGCLCWHSPGPSRSSGSGSPMPSHWPLQPLLHCPGNKEPCTSVFLN